MLPTISRTFVLPLIILLAVPFAASAAADWLPNANCTVSVSPQNPQPGQSVTFSWSITDPNFTADPSSPNAYQFMIPDYTVAGHIAAPARSGSITYIAQATGNVTDGLVTGIGQPESVPGQYAAHLCATTMVVGSVPTNAGYNVKAQSTSESEIVLAVPDTAPANFSVVYWSTTDSSTIHVDSCNQSNFGVSAGDEACDIVGLVPDTSYSFYLVPPGSLSNITAAAIKSVAFASSIAQTFPQPTPTGLAATAAGPIRSISPGLSVGETTVVAWSPMIY
jgi:hypothetical protein